MPNHRPEKWLISCGMLLCASGCLHLIIWLASGESWTGPVSWRKPALFGISGGLTILSLGWLLPKLSPRRRDRLLAPLAAISMLFEVGLISLQQWRGVPSHFNHSTILNWWIDVGITGLITLIALVIFDYTLRSLGRLKGSPAEVLAWKSGMIYLALSCLIGFGVFAYGQWRINHGLDPEVFRGRGVMKFPHGIVIHAIQVLPACAWIMHQVDLQQATQVRISWSLIASFGLQLIFSCQQTLAGRERFDITLASGLILSLSFALLLILPAALLIALYARLTEKTLL